MTSLTTANSVITLTIPGIFSSPQQLQGFTVDDVADVDTLTVAETLMGVDGILSGGFVFNSVKYTYSLQADSPSVFIFDQWYTTEKAQREKFVANGNMLMRSLGTKWTWTKGFLHDYSPAPKVKRIAQPRIFSVMWQDVQPQPS